MYVFINIQRWPSQNETGDRTYPKYMQQSEFFSMRVAPTSNTYIVHTSQLLHVKYYSLHAALNAAFMASMHTSNHVR